MKKIKSKDIFLVILVGLITLCFGVKSFAYDRFVNDNVSLKTGIGVYNVHTFLDNEEFISVAPSIKYNSRTFVPIRAISESLGGKVEWDHDSKTATIVLDDKVINIQIDNPIAEVNGQKVDMYDKIPAKLFSFSPTGTSYTMVPIRFVAENLGMFVYYNDTPSAAYLVNDNDELNTIHYAQTTKNGISLQFEKPLGPYTYNVIKEAEKKTLEISFSEDITNTSLNIFNGINISKTLIVNNNILTVDVSDMDQFTITNKDNEISINRLSNSLSSIQNYFSDKNTFVKMTGDYSLDYNLLELESRLVLDLSSTVNNLQKLNMDVKSNQIDKVRTSQYDSISSGNSNITRVVFDLKDKVSNIPYKIISMDKSLLVVLGEFNENAIISNCEYSNNDGINTLTMHTNVEPSYYYKKEGSQVTINIFAENNFTLPAVNSNLFSSISLGNDDTFKTSINLTLKDPSKDIEIKQTYNNGVLSFELIEKKGVNLKYDKTQYTSMLNLIADNSSINNVVQNGTILTFDIYTPGSFDNTGRVFIKDGIIEYYDLTKTSKGYKCTIKLSNGAKIVSSDTSSISLKNDVLLYSNNPKYTIVLDPGHGGYDSGAVAENASVLEKTINLDVALKLKELLEQDNYNVVLTREKDVYVALYDRAAVANNINANIFISIHANSTSNNYAANGLESIYATNVSGKKEFADLIIESIADTTSAPIRRRQGNDNFIVTRETKMHSVLIEVGFLSNEQERAKLKTDSYRYLLAEGFKSGIDSYFQLNN